MLLSSSEKVFLLTRSTSRCFCLGPNKVGKAQVAVTPLESTVWTKAAFEDSARSGSRNSPGASRRVPSFSNPASKTLLGLHCGITYVSVPCEHIINAIFGSPKETSLPVSTSVP